MPAACPHWPSSGLVRGFEAWWQLAEDSRARKARMQTREDRARIEHDRSESRNENGELKMVVTARDDEISALKAKLGRTQDTLSGKEVAIHTPHAHGLEGSHGHEVCV